jgi:alpha-D-xyloside xylohydrolase
MTTLKKLAAGTFVFLAAATVFAGSPQLPLLNDPVDISGDFRDFSDTYFLADHLTRFDPATASGKITYQRAQYFTRQAFDNMLAVIKPVAPTNFRTTNTPQIRRCRSPSNLFRREPCAFE